MLEKIKNISIKKVFETIMLSSVTIFVFSMHLVGIVGGVWLLLLGEWGLVIFALFISLIFPYVYGIIMLIQFPLVALSACLVEKKISGMIVTFINILIGDVVNLLWIIIVFSYMLGYSEGVNIIPYLLFGYGITVEPFQYMILKEPPDNRSSFITLFLIQISYLIFAIFCLINILFLALPVVILLTLIVEIYTIKYVYKLQENENKLL